MTEQDKQALIKHFCSRDCGEAAEGCTIMPCHEIELIQEFPTTEALPPASCSEFPNSSDTISRQQAIDTLRGYLVGKRCPDDGTLTCRLIENEVINKLPPAQLGANLAEVGTDCISRADVEPLQPWEVLAAQAVLSPPEPHWIPVTERLPDISKSVLICDIEDDIYLGHRTRYGDYYPDFCDDRIKNVTAWMPLPEPYKESEVTE